MEKLVRYNVEATDENVLNSIKENTYGRAEYVKNFIETLDMIDTNMFISLDAKWGEGKSFFVRQIEMALRFLYLKQTDVDSSELNDYFANSFLKDINLKNSYLPIYYNSWKYDYHNDPLLSLLFVILKQCSKFIPTSYESNKISDKIMALLSSIQISISNVDISINVEKIREKCKGKDLLEEIKLAEDIQALIKEILNDVIVESAQKLVIIIDELDRCKPSYAIELLERIKHYFDDDRIIFIASLNKEQLVHTISKYYGNEFDSTGYLNRFFDYTMILPEVPEYKKEIILNDRDRQSFLLTYSRELAEYYKLSLRDYMILQQRLCNKLNDNMENYTTNGCMLSIFVPLLHVLEIVDQNYKKKFLDGDLELFDELFSNVLSLKKMARFLVVKKAVMMKSMYTGYLE